jgi:membrane associated rhomboid family serine protease
VTGYPPAGQQPYPQQQLPVCVRHPDRPTGLRCVRCDRPACPECLREASVGYQCVDCVAQGRRTVRQPTTVAGARVAGGQPGRPAMSTGLVAVNLAVFAATAAQAGSIGSNDRSPLFDSWVLWPRGIVSFDEPWRLVTSGFLHFGPIHLALNMIALWIIGRDIEPVLGRARFLAVYALALLGGGVSVFLFSDVNGGTAGASGAVWGLMGALLVLVLRLKLNPQPVLAVIAINAVISFLPGISLLGHLGGFVTGCLATAALVYAPRERLVPIQTISLAMLGLILLALTVVRWAQLST